MRLAIAVAFLAGAAPARAAADDLNVAPILPADQRGIVAAGRRLLDRVIESERAVVQALQANAAATSQSGSWQRGTGAALDGRPTAIAARATAAADAAADPLQHGAAPGELSFGARLRVLRGDADSHVPCVAWMADVQPATSSAPARTAALRPAVHLSAEWALPNGFSLGLMPGVTVDLDAQGRPLANGTLAVTLGRSWTPQWRTFVDLARDRLTGVPGRGISTTLDAGVTFLANASTQVDVALTHGLTPAAPTFQAGVGVSASF